MVSKFAGFRGTFWFAGWLHFQGVWISMKESSLLALESTNFQKNSPPFLENNMVIGKHCEIIM